jgi:hypothetical protein
MKVKTNEQRIYAECGYNAINQIGDCVVLCNGLSNKQFGGVITIYDSNIKKSKGYTGFRILYSKSFLEVRK